jgi:hypothetical protein
MLPNSFYEDTMMIMFKADKISIQKEKKFQVVGGIAESVIRRFPYSLCPLEANPSQDMWVQMEFIKS